MDHDGLVVTEPRSVRIDHEKLVMWYSTFSDPIQHRRNGTPWLSLLRIMIIAKHADTQTQHCFLAPGTRATPRREIIITSTAHTQKLWQSCVFSLPQRDGSLKGHSMNSSYDTRIRLQVSLKPSPICLCRTNPLKTSSSNTVVRT